MALLLAARGPGRAAEVPRAASPVIETEALDLKPDLYLEREIRPEVTRVFDLRLSAGALLYLEITPRDLSLLSRLLGPDGKPLALAEGSDPQLLVARVDRDCSSCRLEITARGTKVSERLGLRVLDLRPARPGDEARAEAAALLAESRHLSALHDKRSKDRAVALLSQSLTAWRKSEDARGEVETLLARAALRRDDGDMEGALAGYGEALARAELKGLAKEQARILGEMGACSTRLSRYREAVDLYQRALEIWDRIGGPYSRASVRQDLGLCLLKLDPEAALRTFKEAQAFAEASGDLFQQGRALSGLASGQYYLYQLAQARDTWDQALRLSQQAGDPANETMVEQNLGVLYLNQGELQKALDLFIRLAPKAPSDRVGVVRYNLGLVYLELGDPDKALESFEISRAASHSVSDVEGEAAALILIGRAQQRKGDPGSALAEYRRAQTIFPNERWDVLNSIGLAQIDLGRPGEALTPLQKALDLARASRNRSQESATLLALGVAQGQLGQAGPAVETLDRALAIGKEIGYQAVLAPILLRRALLLRDQGRLEAAQADVEEALNVVESTRRNIGLDQFRVGFSATRRTYYDLDGDLLLRLGELHPEQDRYRTLAFETSERAKARGLLDLLAEGRIDLSQGLDPDLRRRDADLASQLSRVQRQLRGAEVKPDRLKELQAEAKRLEEQREQLDLEIRAKNPRYAEVRYPVPLKLDQIQSQLLDGRTALLEYSLGEKRSTLFVITREQIRVYELPGRREITDRVRRLRATLEHESLLTRKDYEDVAFQLYRDLLEPASEALEGRTGLLIVPDDALYYVPFEALLTEPAKGRSPRDLPFLVRRFSIAYVPSASVLAGLRASRQEPAQAAGRQQVAAFAPFAPPEKPPGGRSPVRETAVKPGARPVFEPLPASRREVSELSSLYAGAALTFVGDAASESAFKNDPAVASARRLHLATHAQINEAQPELSALILAPGGGEDGDLDVREIFGLRLSADLAVLSACETGLGKEVTGEGLIGLTRAFFYAGVPSLVVSLWNVVDSPNPELMKSFYQGLDRYQDKSKALQSAKLAMIAQGTYAYPTYWAAFILLGEPR